MQIHQKYSQRITDQQITAGESIRRVLGETQRCSSAPIKMRHFDVVTTQQEARRCRKQERQVKVKQAVLQERSYRSCLRWVHAGKAPTYLSSGSGSTRCRRSGEETGQASRWHFPPSPYTPPATVHVETREKTRTSPGAHVPPGEPSRARTDFCATDGNE